MEIQAELLEAAPSLAPQRIFSIMVVLMLTLLLVALDQTIQTTAMPKIVATLHGFDRYAWVSTSYILASTIAVPIFGKLSDMYGRKWFLLSGTALFVLASLLCGASGIFPALGDGMNQLIVFRGLQGLGGGMITSQVFTIIGDLFPPAVRGKYQGYFAAVWLFASIAGPVLGGWLTDLWSWRLVFYINLPIGIIAICVLALSFPNKRSEAVKHTIDYLGIVTLSLGLIAFLLALTWISDFGLLTLPVISTLLLSLVLFSLFLWAERRAVEPLFQLALLRNSIFSITLVSIFLSSIGAYSVILYVTLFIQQVMGLSATLSGALATPMMLTLIISTVIGGQLISRQGRYKKLALIGLASMTVGALLLAFLHANSALLLLVVDLVLVAIGLGVTTPLYTIVAQNAVSHSHLGVVTAFTQLVRQFGVAIGVTASGAVLQTLYRSHFEQIRPMEISSAQLSAFMDPLQLSQNRSHLQAQFAQYADGTRLLQQLLHSANLSLSYALTTIFLLGGIMLAVTVVLNFFLAEIPLRTSNKDTSEASQKPVPLTGEAQA